MKHEEQTQTHARDLYFQSDLTTTQIANILSIPRRTLHYWIKQKNWDREKKAAAHMPSLLAENCYHLIAKFTEQLLSETRLMKPITPKEADALYKLTLTVNKLKNRYTLNESMELFGNFMDKINAVAPDLAKQVSPFVDECIANQSSKYVSQYRPDHFNSQGLIPVPEENVKEKQLDLADIMDWADEEAKLREEIEQSIATAPPYVPPTSGTVAPQPIPTNPPQPEAGLPGPDVAPATTPEQQQKVRETLTALGWSPKTQAPQSLEEYLSLGGSNNRLYNTIRKDPPPGTPAKAA